MSAILYSVTLDRRNETMANHDLTGLEETASTKLDVHVAKLQIFPSLEKLSRVMICDSNIPRAAVCQGNPEQ